MEQEFRSILKNTVSVADMVGARIDFGIRPNGQSLPAIVLNTISDIQDIHMNGIGLNDGRVQVDCYGATYKDSFDLSQTVLLALNFYRGGGFLIIEHLSTQHTRDSGSNEVSTYYRAGMDFKTAWRLT